MASVTRTATSVVNGSGAGSGTWTNPSNAAAEDGSYAFYYASSASQTQYLKATSFGFTIPSDAVIDGIMVEWKRDSLAASFNTVDYRSRLVKAGAVQSTDKADTGTAWPYNSFTWKSYGGASDLWGDTWTPADINAGSFGAALAADCVQNGYPRVDSVRITVYYTVFTWLDGTAVAESSASASLTTSITMATSVSGVASASADMTTQIKLVGSASAVATATLDNTVYLSGSVSAVASASASLTTQIKLAGTATAVAAATATMILPVQPSVRFATGIYLAEITGASGSVYRFASGNRGFDNAGTFYAPRIENPASFSRSIGGASIGGRGQSSLGECTLLNGDNALDAMMADYFDGRQFKLLYGDQNAAYGTFITALVSTIETLGFERQRVSVRLRDRALSLDAPFSTAKYAGTNDAILPLGLEGTADSGIKSQSKPRVFGRVALMAPTQVNSSHLIYQVSDKACAAVVTAFDAGSYLVNAGTYANTTTLQAVGQAPLAGSYKVYSGSEGTYFRLGATPFGAITACVAEDWDHVDISTAGVIQRILTEKGFVSGTDFVAADFTTLNQKNVGPIGVIVNPDETTSQLIDRIATNAGCFWGLDYLNRFRIARLEAPAGTPVMAITDDYIIEIDRQPEQGYPAWETTVAADRNYSVADKSGLTGVALADGDRASWFQSETRDQKAADAAVKTTRLLAESKESADGLWASVSQAQAEATRRLNMLKVRRDTVTVTLVDPQNFIGTVDVGSVVSLQSVKLGYGAGRLMLVTGMGVNYRRKTMDLTLWG